MTVAADAASTVRETLGAPSASSERTPALVSVVIPVYNQASYLPAAIESALAQTFRRHEIILVDDGSTDDVDRVVERYAARIRLVRQKNQGLAAARNTGIRHAQSQVICLLDADDEWLPTYLERMVARMSEDPEAAVYYCCAQAMDTDGNCLPRVFGSPTGPTTDMLGAMLRANFIIPSTVMMNRARMGPGEYFDAAFRRLQDWELWVRLLRQGCRFRWVPDVLAKYRIHGGSLSIDSAGGREAATALAVKHFGVDDGKPDSWSPGKRRAYGGVYRYHALSFVQSQQDWRGASACLASALRADPTLAGDLDLFYDSIISVQPCGSRGTGPLNDFDQASRLVEGLLRRALAEVGSRAVGKRAVGTLYLALAVASYDLGTRRLFRRYYLKALAHRPDLVANGGYVARWFKSYLDAGRIATIKKVLGRSSRKGDGLEA